ncbi:MAG: hypothetical protein U1G07_10900 [Verrucomicrobiota bacterium]
MGDEVLPPDHVADYMAVHTFFTGVRGVMAPIVAFHAIQTLEIHYLGWIAAVLIFLSCLLLVPELKAGRTARRAKPAIEELSE